MCRASSWGRTQQPWRAHILPLCCLLLPLLNFSWHVQADSFTATCACVVLSRIRLGQTGWPHQLFSQGSWPPPTIKAGGGSTTPKASRNTWNLKCCLQKRSKQSTCTQEAWEEGSTPTCRPMSTFACSREGGGSRRSRHSTSKRRYSSSLNNRLCFLQASEKNV